MSTMADSLVVGRAARIRAAFAVVSVVAGSLFIAGLAQVSIRLPFTPVPITGQTLGVLLVGASLGPFLGTAAVGLYLLEGAIGLPFFAGGESGVSVLGAASATGGYLWGFVLAATLVGWLARRGWDRSIRSSIGAMFLGEVVIYAVGVPWLMSAVNLPLSQGLEKGLYPFVIGDTIKLLIAAGVLPAVWKLIRRYLPDR
ncbi:MAG: biotin transporter BioY [Actinomycetota bacterium]|nr:biotin transporter BioY [Actinomycetota bacterium]